MKKILLPAVGCSALTCALSSPKIRFLMRASVIIWLSMAISLHLAAFDTNGQGIDTEITLEIKTTTLVEALRVLQNKTGMPMVYAPDMVEGYDNISLSHAKRTVRAILEIILKETDLTYLERDNAIVLRRKAKAEVRDVEDAIPLSVPTKAYIVSGKITDATTGDLLPGVSVLVKGTTRGTSSDAQGTYAIEVEPDETLQFSFVGFKTYEALVQNRTTIDVEMVTDVMTLKEVIVSTDYFSTSKERSTMNISKIEGKEIENQPVTSLMNALVGRVPGIDITPQNGFSGRASTIQIRGTNSINAASSFPLFIIDGVQIDSRPLQGVLSNNSGYDPLGGLSPNDIETIEVLKDAGATAIYGSRGANGVIRITTKRAKNRDGKTNFDLNLYSGIGQVANEVDLLNRKEYLQMRHEAFANAGINPNPNSNSHSDINGIWDTTRTTNWQDVLLGGTANINDLQASFSGGSEFTSFKLGGGYHKETTVFPGDFAYHRATADLSLRHLSSNKKFEITGGINFGHVKNETYDNASFVDLALNLPPIAPRLYNDDGSLNWQLHGFSGGAITRNTWQNPMAALLYRSNNITNSIVSSATLSYEIISGLRVKSLLSLTNIYNNLTNRKPIAALSPTLQSTATASMTFADNNRKSFMIEPQITYQRNLENHHINTVFGATFQQARTIYKSVEGLNYPSDALLGSTKGAGSVTSIEDNNTEYKYASTYLHLGYDFMGRYLLDITGRRDGSSRFGPGKRFGNFGAIAAGWIFSEETFIKSNIEFISFGKIRSSYGITGNDQIGDYQYLDTYQTLPIGYQDGVSLIPSAPYNPDYAWESTKKFEAAVELGFIKNRVTLDAAWYRNLSSNQLINYALSAQTGFASVLENFDATIENTGWEFTVTTKNISKENFNWSTSFNLSAPRNKLLKFDGIESSSYALTYKVGEPLSIQRRYVYKGVNPETGLFEVNDLNNDGFFDEENDMQFMNPLGRFSYAGIMNSLSYKNIELTFLIQFSDSQMPYLFNSQPGSLSNQPVQALDRWRETGDNARYQKYVTGFNQSYGYANLSNFNTTDASFIRLKTLSVSYILPNILTDRIKLQHAQIYLQGQNLFTITDYPGLDPETGNTMPPLRMVTIGLRVKL